MVLCTLVVIWAAMLSVFAPKVPKARHQGVAPYSRPRDPGSLGGVDELNVVSLRDMKELRKKIQQHKLGDLMGQLSSIDIGSSADTCSATWKNGDDEAVTVWAHRGSSMEAYQLRCVNFYKRFDGVGTTESTSDPFDVFFPEGGVPHMIGYMSRYYVNLNYFISTELEGDDQSCQQQLDGRVQGSPGVYRWAFDFVSSVPRSALGNWSFWARDEEGNTRGVEIAMTPRTGEFKITSLSVLSQNKLSTPSAYPIDHSRAEELTKEAWSLVIPRHELLSYDLLLACGKAAAGGNGELPTKEAAIRLIHSVLLKEN